MCYPLSTLQTQRNPLLRPDAELLRLFCEIARAHNPDLANEDSVRIEVARFRRDPRDLPQYMVRYLLVRGLWPEAVQEVELLRKHTQD